MNGSPIDLVQYGIITLGAVLWVIALVRGRALEWFVGPSQLPPWNIAGSEFLAFVAAFCVATFAAPMLGAWMMDYDGAAKPVPARTAMVVGYVTQLAWLGVCGIFCAPRFLRPRAGAMRMAPAILAGVCALFLFFPVFVLVGKIWQLALPHLRIPTELQESINYLRNVKSAAELAGWIGLVVILAPVAEEWVFRRLVYRYLAGVLPESLAIVVSAVAFAILHQNAVSFVPLIVLGIALCLAYRYTGRLVTPIVMHALFNLNTVIFVIVKPDPLS